MGKLPDQGVATHRIHFDAGVAGLIFAIIGMVLLFVFLNLEYWQLFACAVTFGLVIALVLYFLNRSALPHEIQSSNEEYPHPGITMHRIRFGAGFAGILFTIGCMTLFLAGLPILWWPFVGAITLGVGIATVLHFLRR